MYLFPRAVRLLAAVGAAVAAVGSTAAVAAPADPPGTVTLPGHTSAYAPYVSALTGDGAAVAFEVTQSTGASTIVYRVDPGDAWHSLAVPHSAFGIDVVGTRLGYVDVDESTGNLVATHFVDLTTGVDRTVPLGDQEFYNGVTADGVLVVQPAASGAFTFVDRVPTDATTWSDTTVATIPADVTVDSATLSDAHSMVYVVDDSTGSTPHFVVHLLDITSGADTTLGETTEEPIQEALTPTYAYWSTGTTVARRPRSGTGPVQSRELPSPSIFAADDTDVEWLPQDQVFLSLSASGTAPRRSTAPAFAQPMAQPAGLGASRWERAALVARTAASAAARSALAHSAAQPGDAAVAPADGTGTAATLAGGTAVVGVGSTGTTLLAVVGVLAGEAHVATIAPDGTATPIYTSGTTSASFVDLALSAGRLVEGDDRSTALPIFARSLSATAPIAVGAERRIGSRGYDAVTSGRRMAYVDVDASRPVVVVRDGSRVVRRLSLPEDFFLQGLTLSGTRLLARGFDTGGYLFDLQARTVVRTPATSSLYGHELAYADASGVIVVRNLDKPLGRDNPVPVAQPCGRQRGCVLFTAVAGAQVAWLDFSERTGEPVVTVENRATHATTRVHGVFDLGGLTTRSFAYVDAGGTLRLVDTRHPGSPRRHLAAVSSNGAYAVTATTAAWVGTDGRVRVARTTTATPAPRLLTKAPSAAISPDGDGKRDRWRPEFVTDTSLASWTLVLTDAHGRTVLRRSGQAALGDVRASIGGRGPHGRLPDGVYRWRFTGTGAAGASAVHAAGRLAVHRHTPAARLAAPALSTTSSKTATVAVHWRSLAAAAGPYHATSYDVRYRQRVATAHGWRWGPQRRLARGTRLTTGLLRGSPGHTYWLSARVHDDAGNTGPWSTPTSTSVPLDDFAPAVHFSREWSTDRGDAVHFLGSQHRGYSPGETLRVADAGSRFAVVGDRCPGCGAFAVYVDGVHVADVSTRAAGVQHRRRLVDLALGGGIARHVVRLVTIGTSNGGVRVDGVAFVR